MVLFLFLTLVFFVLTFVYFRIADYFNIIDKPNERSSHSQLTIRGAGVLFPIAWLLFTLFHGFIMPWATIGLMAIAVVSFADDRMALSNRLRFVIHIFAFTCCFFELNLFSILSWWMIPIVYIVGIGCLNAVNFMDGINGMTGLYSLSVLLPVQWALFGTFWNGSLFNYLMVAIGVFGFFNFRKKARCFAGDVGSVSMGYILVFILLGFIFHRFNLLEKNSMNFLSGHNEGTVSIYYILLLTLYGLDTILTLIQRLYLKENIFLAHRRHLYQLLANEFHIPHIIVSFVYATLQAAIAFYIFHVNLSAFIVLLLLLIATLVYSLFKWVLIIKLRT
jgi:UDP-N-acetylmuramyl pentapeptide phosphotransferase/UDP-N-acetylglucosamine-1-phosphate transferase